MSNETNAKKQQEHDLMLVKRWLNSEVYKKTLTERLKITDACSRDKQSQALAFQLCKEDPVFFIENFGWTFDPRREPFHFPFILYDYQKDFVRWVVQKIKVGEDGLTEKSRDMGATWIFVWVLYWFWRFNDAFNGLLGSYKEKLVDDRCYSNDTEVLTKDGWKLFKDVNIKKDIFATRNRVSKEFEWQEASNKVEYDYNGEAYNLKSRSMDLLVSPNHRILYSKHWGNIEHIDKAKDLYGYGGVSIPATSKWTGKEIKEFELKPPKSEIKDYGRGRTYKTQPSGGIKMSGDDFCAFMGMYLAEGCAVSKHKKYNSAQSRISIAQSEYSKGFKEYQELLIRIFDKEPNQNKIDGKIVGWTIRNKMFYQYLAQFGYSYEKFIPTLIKNASKKQLEIFLYYYMLGDGCFTTSLPTMTTVSKKLADGLQEVIQKIGKSTSISIEEPRDNFIGNREIKKENCRKSYNLRIRTTKYQKVKIEKVSYNGKIYCVTVPNEILYVRRNGKPAWCGNTTDSLFGKLDYCLQNTPKWLIPRRFKPKEHRQKLKLVNPENFNLLSGDTMNPDFSRGARKNVVFMDEGAAWDYFREAWESAGDSTPCRLTVSTPQGRNAFAILRESGIDVMTLHWRLHPIKDETWYEYQKLRRTDEEVAQELDISYQRSQVGRVYPEWNDVEYGHFPYNEYNPLYVSWDFGRTDQTAIVWWQKEGKGLYVVDSYANIGKTIDFYVPFITGVLPSEDHKYSKKDFEVIELHKNWRRAIHFGDPAGRFRNQVSDKSVLDVLNEYGIKVNFREEAKDFQTRRTETKLILRGLRVNNNERTKELGAAMENARYPEVRRGGGLEIRAVKPRHDWTCLAKGTPIRTLSGWKKIEELVNKDFYVWSYSQEEKRLVPTKAKRCWKTHDNAPLIEIGLDNGESVFATPEHLFMTRNEEWKRTDEISVGDSLMPFYEFNNRCYVRIDLNDGSVADEHTYVFSRLIGNIPLDNHVDHIDNNKINNNPKNLQALSQAEHCRKTFKGKNMEERRAMSKNVKPYITNHSRAIVYRFCLHCGKEFKGDHKTFYCDKKCSMKAYKERNSFEKRKERKNHKVRFVKNGGYGEVYDIEVPKYNNFVANGVIVHNSHYRSSVEYFAVNYSQLVGRGGKRVYDKFTPKDSPFPKKRRAIRY